MRKVPFLWVYVIRKVPFLWVYVIRKVPFLWVYVIRKVPFWCLVGLSGFFNQLVMVVPSNIDD